MSETENLIKVATDARLCSRAPFSNFLVGAALRTAEGKIYTGCNIESASYGLTVCAERVVDAARVRRAIGKVAVIIVGGEEHRVPVAGGAAVDGGRRIALAAAGDAIGALARRQAAVPDAIHLAPALRRSPLGHEHLREVPVRRGRRDDRHRERDDEKHQADVASDDGPAG